MTEALITPELIIWARERQDLTPDRVAEKVNVSINKFSAWEKGDARPTLRQAQNIAHILHVPFGYLFLSAPPIESLPLPDLRTMAGTPHRKPSPDFLEVLHDVLRKQEWYRDHQKAEGAAPVPFVGRFDLQDNADTIAIDIRNTLGINQDMRQKATNWEQFLTEFIHQSESKGILVLRSGIVGSNTLRKLSVNEFRGFVIADSLAPIVFINSNDFKVAQIFTLAHELAHLWIGQNGVSNLDYFKRSSEQVNAIDRFCDKIAAETLTPRNDFQSYWGLHTSIEQNVEFLAQRYRVSRFVVLRRAYDLDLISYVDYQAHYQAFLEDKKTRTEDGGGSFDRNLLSHNSSTFTFTLLVSALEGKTTHKEAARLLNVKMKTLTNIQNRLLVSEPRDA